MADIEKKDPIRLGMVGGGQDSFIGEVHRIAARLDDNYLFVQAHYRPTPNGLKSQALN